MYDKQQNFSTAQALTATALSTNAYDLSQASQELGGDQMVGVFVDVAADTASGNETYQFDFITSANANLSSSTTVISRTIDKATLIAGYKFAIPIPKGQTLSRYIGMNYVLGGTTPTITVTAILMHEEDFAYWKAYPDAITIS